MRKYPSWSDIAVCAAAAMLLAGCGSSSRYPTTTVEGSVTIDGAPVPKGYVIFTPEAGTSGPAVGAPIAEGRYRCEKVPLGKHTVTFQAQAAEMDTIVERASGAVHEVPRDILPARYLAGVPLEVLERQTRHDFELTTDR